MIIKCDLNPDNVIAAINCGGEAYKDSRGIIYEKVKKYINFRMTFIQVVKAQISEPILRSN